jgi:hypothetical protein
MKRRNKSEKRAEKKKKKERIYTSRREDPFKPSLASAAF